MEGRTARAQQRQARIMTDGAVNNSLVLLKQSHFMSQVRILHIYAASRFSISCDGSMASTTIYSELYCVASSIMTAKEASPGEASTAGQVISSRGTGSNKATPSVIELPQAAQADGEALPLLPSPGRSSGLLLQQRHFLKCLGRVSKNCMADLVSFCA